MAVCTFFKWFAKLYTEYFCHLYWSDNYLYSWKLNINPKSRHRSKWQIMPSGIAYWPIWLGFNHCILSSSEIKHTFIYDINTENKLICRQMHNGCFLNKKKKKEKKKKTNKQTKQNKQKKKPCASVTWQLKKIKL